MKLLVDIGNTRLKSALLDQGALIEPRSLVWRGESLRESLEELWRGFVPSAVAIASVAPDAMVNSVSQYSQSTWNKTPDIARVQKECFGLHCGYLQPESLGVDRWLAMLGAWGRQQTSWLVADLGTAATLDVIDSSGRHLGGCIFAGIETQRRALSRSTAALPQVDRETHELLARETREGVALGTLLSVVGGVRELYSNARDWPQCEGLQLCLTGGASPVVARRLGLDHEVFPSLVLEGLAMSVFAEKISTPQTVANAK
ncbi:MAG: type III pantothenate kinase [Granulosicoccaceae bacterium]